MTDSKERKRGGMTTLSDLSLVVLNYQCEADTLFCVERLLSFGSDFHIIVVDNQSPDGSYERLKAQLGGRPCVDVLQSERNGGYSYGNNYGMRYAIEHYGSTVLGILNPDVILPRLDVLSVMKERLESDPTFAVIGGACITSYGTYNPNLFGWSIPTGRELLRQHFCIRGVSNRNTLVREFDMIGESTARIGCIQGCYYLMKTSVMQEIGFLDESVFMYHEENILGIRIRRAGYKEVLALDQFYVHNHKKVVHRRMPFKKKLASSKATYESLKYLLRTYYSPTLLPLLWCVEMLNRLYLGCAWVANLFLKERELKPQNGE